MKVVQELVAYFDRRGKLSRRQLRSLLEQHAVASEAPTNMHGLCETVGATYYFRVTGVTEGQLWGTDIYSGDFDDRRRRRPCRPVEAGGDGRPAGDRGHATREIPGHRQEWRDQHRIRALSVRLEAVGDLIAGAAPSRKSRTPLSRKRHADHADECPKLGVKQRTFPLMETSLCDPSAT